MCVRVSERVREGRGEGTKEADHRLLLLSLLAEVITNKRVSLIEGAQRGCTESAASCDCCQNNITAPRVSPRTRTLFRRSFSGRISGIWLAAPSATAALSTATAGSRPAAAAAAPDGCEEPPGCWLLVPAATLLLPALLRGAAAVAAALLLPAAAAAALLLPAAPAAEGPEQTRAGVTEALHLGMQLQGCQGECGC